MKKSLASLWTKATTVAAPTREVLSVRLRALDTGHWAVQTETHVSKTAVSDFTDSVRLEA